MKPVLLSTGEIIHPVARYDGGQIVDAMTILLPGEPEYEDWKADAVQVSKAGEAELRSLFRQELAAGRRRPK